MLAFTLLLFSYPVHMDGQVTFQSFLLFLILLHKMWLAWNLCSKKISQSPCCFWLLFSRWAGMLWCFSYLFQYVTNDTAGFCNCKPNIGASGWGLVQPWESAPTEICSLGFYICLSLVLAWLRVAIFGPSLRFRPCKWKIQDTRGGELSEYHSI